MHSIYVLIDPRNDEVFYVGLTEDVYARFLQHLRANSKNRGKDAKIRELRHANVMLIMRTVETTTTTLHEARERESFWIQHYVQRGSKLLNVVGEKSDMGASTNLKIEEAEPVDDDYLETDEILRKYPKIEKWLIAGRKSATVYEIAAATGLSVLLIDRQARAGVFKKAKRHGCFRLDSVAAWLRTVPAPKVSA